MIWTKPKTVNMAKPAWAVEPAGHVEAMLVLGDPPGAEYFRLDLPGKAAYKLGRLAEQCDVHIQVKEGRGIVRHMRSATFCMLQHVFNSCAYVRLPPCMHSKQQHRGYMPL